MIFNLANALLAMGPPPGTSPNPKADFARTIGMLVLMIVVFYVIMIRPQRLKAKQLEKTVQALKAGDKIVTSSGIVGTVVNVKEKTLSIRSADAKLEVLKSTILEITERSADPSPSNS